MIKIDKQLLFSLLGEDPSSSLACPKKARLHGPMREKQKERDKEKERQKELQSLRVNDLEKYFSKVK